MRNVITFLTFVVGCSTGVIKSAEDSDGEFSRNDALWAFALYENNYSLIVQALEQWAIDDPVKHAHLCTHEDSIFNICYQDRNYSEDQEPFFARYVEHHINYGADFKKPFRAHKKGYIDRSGRRVYDGYTPLEMSLINGHNAATRVLIEKGATGTFDRLFTCACFPSEPYKMAGIASVVNLFSPEDLQDAFEEHPAYWSHVASLAFVDLLKKNGFENAINAKDQEGNTLLHRLVEREDREQVEELLIRHGLIKSAAAAQ